MTFTHAVSTDNYGPAKWIVDPSAANGTHTTIAGALASASSGDTIFIRPATYTENLTLKNGVNLAGLDFAGGSGPATVIIGKLIDNGATVNTTFTNISLRTNSDFSLVATGASSAIVLCDCNYNCANNTGMSISGSATITLQNCTGDVGAIGAGIFTGSGNVIIRYSNFANSGGSSTQSTTSGLIFLEYSKFATPFSVSSISSIDIEHCIIDTSAQNATCVTTAGTGSTSFIKGSIVSSGSASAVSIGAGTTVTITSSDFKSSNTNVLTGAGTLQYAFIAFSGSSSGHNVTTETALSTLI